MFSFIKKLKARSDTVRLRFIGRDGSMGLKHGNTYDVKVLSLNNLIWVRIDDWFFCPYRSPKTFSENWES